MWDANTGVPEIRLTLPVKARAKSQFAKTIAVARAPARLLTAVQPSRLHSTLQIYGLSAPTNARSHCLIAAGLGDPNVRTSQLHMNQL